MFACACGVEVTCCIGSNAFTVYARHVFLSTTLPKGTCTLITQLAAPVTDIKKNEYELSSQKVFTMCVCVLVVCVCVCVCACTIIWPQPLPPFER